MSPTQAPVTGAGRRFPPPSVLCFVVPAGANQPGTPTLGKVIWMGCHTHSRPVFQSDRGGGGAPGAHTEKVVSALCLGIFG